MTHEVLVMDAAQGGVVDDGLRARSKRGETIEQVERSGRFVRAGDEGGVEDDEGVRRVVAARDHTNLVPHAVRPVPS